MHYWGAYTGKDTWRYQKILVYSCRWLELVRITHAFLSSYIIYFYRKKIEDQAFFVLRCFKKLPQKIFQETPKKYQEETHSKVALQKNCWSESFDYEGFAIKVFIIEDLRISTNITLNPNARFFAFKINIKIVMRGWVHFSEANMPIFFLFSLLVHRKIGKNCNSFHLYGNLLKLSGKKPKLNSWFLFNDQPKPSRTSN